MDDKYSIVNLLTSDQFDQLHSLFQEMWWTKGRTKEDIHTLLKNCIIVAAIDSQTRNLAGFARILTDELRYAFIFDVMTQEDLRGIGLGKLIMQSILEHPQLQNVKYFELTCAPEMTGYYKQFGFTENYGNVVAMRLSTQSSLN